jgi:hypothetical protein
MTVFVRVALIAVICIPEPVKQKKGFAREKHTFCSLSSVQPLIFRNYCYFIAVSGFEFFSDSAKTFGFFRIRIHNSAGND